VAFVATYFRAEVASYARHTVRGDPFGISTVSGQVVGQVSQWLNWNFESQVSPAQTYQSQHAPQVDASALHIAVLQHEAEVDGVGAQATTPAKAATLEPAVITVEHSQGLAAERDRGANLVSELAMTRRDVETKAALLSKASEEAAQLRQTAEATGGAAAVFVQERDRVAAPAREPATARRDLRYRLRFAQPRERNSLGRRQTQPQGAGAGAWHSALARRSERARDGSTFDDRSARRAAR
jgi:hypothetical protein